MVRLMLSAFLAFGLLATPAAAQELVLGITTKLGAKVKADIIAVSAPGSFLGLWFGAMVNSTEVSPSFGRPLAESRLALRQGENCILLFPWSLIESVAAKNKKQVVRLRDGKEYDGEVITEVLARGGKSYPLKSAARISVLETAPLKDAGKPDNKKPALRALHLKAPINLDFAEVTGFILFPRFRNGELSTSKSGELFRVKIDGEELEGNFSDFERIGLNPGKDGAWEMAIKAAGGEEKKGTFLPPTNSGAVSGVDLYDWVCVGQTANGCIVVFKGGFELNRSSGNRAGRLVPISPTKD